MKLQVWRTEGSTLGVLLLLSVLSVGCMVGYSSLIAGHYDISLHDTHFALSIPVLIFVCFCIFVLGIYLAKQFKSHWKNIHQNIVIVVASTFSIVWLALVSSILEPVSFESFWTAAPPLATTLDTIQGQAGPDMITMALDSITFIQVGLLVLAIWLAFVTGQMIHSHNEAQEISA